MPKKSNNKNTASKFPYKAIILCSIVLIFIGTTLHYRHGITYWINTLQNKFNKNGQPKELKLVKYDIRNIEVMDRHYLKTFGLDVSQYQGEIDWKQMHTIYDIYPINFVFIRSTMGSFNSDNKFDYNWKESKKNGLIRGAYHFYRPDENSTAQAQNFINNVKLERGDLPPVLDIENMPKTQPMEKLIEGLKNWCTLIEAHYNIKPIIYTSDKYHQDFLYEHFQGYTIWIANYNFFVEDIKKQWIFWQFTEKGQIKGTKYKVDVNIYNGTLDGIKLMTL